MEMVKATIQRGSVSVSAEGPEAFVRDVLEMWSVVGELPEVEGSAKQPSDISPNGVAASSDKAEGSPSSKYENVYDKVDGQLKIIAHLPGSSKADKARATALVLLYGRYLDGVEQVPSEDIRDACTDQGCFDSGNFAKHLKALAEKVVMNTKHGGGYDVKLTAPGRKAAKELVEELNGAAG